MSSLEHLPPEHEAAARKQVRRVELTLGYLLRIGVGVSILFIASGTIMSFVHHRDYTWSHDAFDRLTHPGAVFFHNVPDVIDGVRGFRGQAWVTVGLLLLIATPVLRVAVSIFVFVHQRDWVFVSFTAIVLVLLLLSFLLGHGAA